MGLLDGHKARKAVTTIVSASSPNAADVIQAGVQLKKLGPVSLQYIIDGLIEESNVDALEQLMEQFISDKTLETYLEALAHDDREIVPSVMRVLSKSTRYDTSLLLEALERADIRKEYVARIIKAQAERINQKRLLEVLSQGSSSIRQTVFQILSEIGDETLIPHLITYSKSESADTRYRVARLMGRFSVESVRTALFDLLKDPNKNVRMAALESLSSLTMPVPSKVICKLLRDPDMIVQSKAIETLIQLNDATIVKDLIEYLQDESEYIRRAAVEVLNEVGNTSAIKDLLMALRDQDWWVRVRAADALGSIGGPRVVDAVLALIKDEDPFLRRTAVEILNTSKDQRAFESLVEALHDEDWWVRERAADALASMGNADAAAPLRELLNQDEQTIQVAMRALASLGDKESVRDLIRTLKSSSNPAVQKEAITALSQLVDESNAVDVQEAVTQLISVNDQDVRQLANETAAELADRFSGGKTQVIPRPQTDDLRRQAQVKAPEPALPDGLTPTPTPSPAKQRSAAEVHMTNAAGGESSLMLIDADRLQPGDHIGNRYKVIKRVGKGGFGTVVLVNDEVVEDQYILKFLNPAFASDASVVQRFTHELRYARKVTHENIIRIYDFLTFGQSYAISMEYFPSHSLADELDKGVPDDMRRMVRILRDICDGMSTAQHVKVVHRDLKPANILIDDNDMVKIVDFGLAAAASQMDGRITKTGILVGTPTYMAPEQARGEEIDSRTDIYSLGVIMYRIFSGRPPYDEKDPMSTLLKHVEGKAPAPRSLNPDIPEHLDAIIRKAMTAQREERYQSFDEFEADLDRLLDEWDHAEN